MKKRSLIGVSLMVTMLVINALPVRACGAEGAISDYQTETAHVPQTPGVSGGAVGAFANPASWATNDRAETAFWWNDASVRGGTLDNWGFSAGKYVGFAMQHSTLGTRADHRSLYDYQLGLAWGDRAKHFGVAYRWATGAAEEVGRENAWALGLIHRPGRRLSYGISTVLTTEEEARRGSADLGIRPFGKSWLTLFADYSLRESDRLADGHWGAGFEIRPLRGIHFGVKLRDVEGGDDYSYSLHAGLTLDQGGFHLLPRYGENGKRRDKRGMLRPTTYLIRLDQPHSGLPLRDFVRRISRSNRYVELDFQDKRLTYQKARFFDDERIAWIDLTEVLDRIKKDRSVAGVAVNLSGFSAGMSLAWEFRRKLEELQQAGKEIIVFIESAELGQYYIASAADHLVMDPQGDLIIPGMAAKRTYLGGLLEKLGIGFDEWRFMKYKSAYETYSRRDLSEGDREQIGRAIDVIYETIARDVSVSRGWAAAYFDRVVEEKPFMMAEQALERDVIDRIGRWHELKDWLEEERDGATLEKPFSRDRWRTYHDDRWGRPPELALVYALGVCAMDEGIRGRATSESLRRLAEKDRVVGVVLRADSPGGEPLPSDLVAEGLQLVKEAEKPAVVSQGNVAGSGGYWISMPGDRILTTPLTITGSIGVIGGWFWDTGLGEKTGFSADGVQRGSHSDLFTGIRFPLLGQLPTRNLTGSERAMAEEQILALYDHFVATVADLRSMTEEEVRDVAQGRIWMGEDAVELGLCDAIGTLPDAIAETKRLAGLDPEEEVILTEFPPRKPFIIPRLVPQVPVLSAVSRALADWFTEADLAPLGEADDYSTAYMKAIAEAKGSPLLLVPPEMLPAGWYDGP